MEENKENTQAITQREGQPVPQSLAGLSALSMFFDSVQFDTVQRVARMLCMSDLVPKEYQYKPVNYINQDGTVNEYLKRQNDAVLNKAMANCIIALNKAAVLRTDPMTIMQNMGLVYGRPSWAATFVIGAINGCGRFTLLKFKFDTDGHIKETFTVYKKDGSGPRKTIDMPNYTCFAYANEKATGEYLEGTPISIRMAFEESWVQKDGSKWVTMPKQMLMYRAAAFFGRTYAPDVMQGMYTREENEDIGPIEDVESEVIQTRMNGQRVKVSVSANNVSESTNNAAQLDAPASQPVQEPAPSTQPVDDEMGY